VYLSILETSCLTNGIQSRHKKTKIWKHIICETRISQSQKLPLVKGVPMFDSHSNKIINNKNILILIVILLMILVISNPKKENFVQYKVKNISEHELVGSEFASGLTKLIGEPLLSATTERKSFVVFSVFTTSDNTKYVGFLKKFFIEL
jgi:hypothetical protein